jgi:hypothetical protein
MSKNTELAAAALAAVQSLRMAAARGDAEAAEHLLNIGNRSAGHLQALATHPKGKPGRTAIDTVAARANAWPVACPAIEEMRLSNIPSIPKSLGSALPFRASKGKTKLRVFSGDSQNDFAMTAFEEIDRVRRRTPTKHRAALLAEWHKMTEAQKNDWRTLSAILPPLDGTKRTLGLWKKAGVRWAEDQCKGQWKSFPWPAEVMNRAEQKTNSRKRGIETAVKEILGKGFASIALPLIRGE